MIAGFDAVKLTVLTVSQKIKTITKNTKADKCMAVSRPTRYCYRELITTANIQNVFTPL